MKGIKRNEKNKIAYFISNIEELKYLRSKFYFLLFVFISFACEQKVKVVDEAETAQTINKSTVDFMDFSNAKKMKEIDSNIDSDKKIESLYWERQIGEGNSQYIQIEGYLNYDGFLMKIVEYFIDGNYQPWGERIYYLDSNKIIVFKENTGFWVDSLTTNHSEKIIIFEDQEPVLSKIRYAENYSDIENSDWQNATAEYKKLDRINKILNGEGEFETHFISVIKGNNLFLLLGENKTEKIGRYTTAVFVEEMTPFIEDLLNNLEEYKFRPVNIRFKVVGGANNTPEFRVLTHIEWKN